MENIKDAKYYAEKIVREDRHKFIYSYDNNRDLLIKTIKDMYPIAIGKEFCALYLEIDGLLKIDFNIPDLNKSALSIICDEYFQFSVASALISSIIDNNDIKKIKDVESTLLEYVNRIMKGNCTSVNSIQTLLKLLQETKQIYYETYCNYLQKGILSNPIDNTPLGFMQLPYFVYYTKKMLGYQNHISLVLNHTKEMCLETYKSINNLLAARINGDISVNILSEPDSWKTYWAQNGQLVEATHDYENVEYDDSSKEYLVKTKKLYQKI